jgi:hypothetical protein
VPHSHSKQQLINLVFKMEMYCVLCEVRTEVLCIIHIDFNLQSVNPSIRIYYDKVYGVCFVGRCR